MNRLAPQFVRAAITTVWFASAVMATAQSAFPPSPPATGNSAKPVAASPDAARAALVAAQTALQQQDYAAAVRAIRTVRVDAKASPQLAAQVNALRQNLVKIGIDPALLSPPPAPKPLAAPGGAIPIAGLSAADTKAEALRLVAIGRAALDRGDVASAWQAAQAARELEVPESEFAPGEPRVWQLVLDAESAAKKAGLFAGGPGNGVAQAGGFKMPDRVSQAGFTGGDAKAGSGEVVQVQNAEEDGTYGQKTFERGMQLLQDGKKAEAREAFRQAWEYRDELSTMQRSQLKDKLTLLRPTRLGGAALPAPTTPIDEAQREATEKTRRLYREVTSELAKAEQNKTTAPLDVAEALEKLRRRVDQADVDEVAKRSLRVMVDRAMSDQQTYIDANRADIKLEIENDAVRTEMARDQLLDAKIDDEVSALVEEFNKRIESRQFEEAEIIAKQVRQLKPNDPISVSMFHVSRMGTRLAIAEEIRAAKEDDFVTMLNDVEASSVHGINPDNPLSFQNSQDWRDLSERRSGLGRLAGDYSDSERVILSKLEQPVSVSYRNQPLGEVMRDLSAITGVPIIINERALANVRVTTEMPVSLELSEPLMLKSALNLVLDQFGLAYVIDNEVLNITSEDAKNSNLETVTYRVADLVTPIPNFTSGYDDGLAGALRAAYQMTQPQAQVQVMPVSVNGMDLSQSGSSMGSNPNVLGQYQSMGQSSGFGPSIPGGGSGGGAMADFQSLMNLIETTVVPDTWEALGGPSTMAPYQQNLSLVISTTSEVHDDIVDLLESLRRLQNLQITIEVRFITLSDEFSESIGIDFDFQFDDNTQLLPSDDAGPSVTIGFDGSVPTGDLDIRFNNESFGTTPPFGPILGSPSSIGFAILSDIEAFFFLQATQADNRSNVMQAPKVTLFDGQIATISDTTQRPFVTSITPVVGDFAVAQQPVIVVLNEGTQLNVQGVVSDDRRFVRLTLVPFFSQIGDVDTFTFEGQVTSRSSSREEEDTNGDGVVDDLDAVDEQESEEIISGTTVQLPQFASTTVSTTVSVPDGGTILLGGIKRLAEGRNENGIPILSKIPYVNRLFRNVAAGRDARSLMLMVTPRIIIQEEEELAQTGFDPNN